MAGGLRILSVNQEKELYGIPIYSQQEREAYFEINQEIRSYLSSFSSLQSKILFILQLGYFRSRHTFWPIDDLLKNKEDLNFICDQFYPTAFRGFTKYKVPINTRLLQQKIIMKISGYKKFGKDNQDFIYEEAGRIVRINARPIHIFGGLINFLEANRIIVPGYSLLQNMIGKAIHEANERLRRVVNKMLKEEQVRLIDWIIQEKTSFLHSLTRLKRDPKNFSYNQIKELTRQKEIIRKFNLHGLNLARELNISQQNIHYYGRLINYYNIHDIKRMNGEQARFLITCFLYTRYRKINDYLVQVFLYRIRKYQKESKTHSQSCLADNQQTSPDLMKLAELLNIFLDDKAIAGHLPFSQVRKKAFAILQKEEIEKMRQALGNDKLSLKYYEWQYMDEISRKIKMNIRPVFLQLSFNGAVDDHFLAVVHLLQDQLRRNLPVPRNLPAGWIRHDNRKYISSEGDIHPGRFETLVYIRLSQLIESGDIYVSNSISYRSMEDDLIPQEEWLDKNRVFSAIQIKCNADSPTGLIEELGNEVDALFKKVNERISSGENKHINLNNRKLRKWSLPYCKLEEEKDSYNFLDQLPAVSLHTLMKMVDDKCSFSSQFTHLLGRYTKKEMNIPCLFGTILALGTNAGLGKMARTSNLSYDQLHDIYQNYVRPETLSKACDSIIEDISKIPVFKGWNIDNDKIYSSSDGQKFETSKDTVNARYSSKYFGLCKGVVSYTLSANYLPLTAKIIGANEYEGHYVLDLLLNNTSEIQPNIHTTDTHGSNRVNFALLHLFGYEFAPRYRNIYEAANSLYCYDNLNLPETSLIKPIKRINVKLIEQEWDNIMRIVASLAKQTISQHTLIRKLSSYPRKNNTRKALSELDKLLRTRYILRYIDELDFRQNIHKALNRGESYHSLKRALFYNDEGKFKVRSEYEQLVWSESTRLLALCVIYYNTFIFNEISDKLNDDNVDQPSLFRYSPIRWKHIDWFGKFHFELEVDRREIEDLLRSIENLEIIRPDGFLLN